ncbi:MAG: hypothetical protein ACXVHW_03415, partial [Methanobacterium sp.]
IEKIIFPLKSQFNCVKRIIRNRRKNMEVSEECKYQFLNPRTQKWACPVPCQHKYSPECAQE